MVNIICDWYWVLDLVALYGVQLGWIMCWNILAMDSQVSIRSEKAKDSGILSPCYYSLWDDITLTYMPLSCNPFSQTEFVFHLSNISDYDNELYVTTYIETNNTHN